MQIWFVILVLAIGIFIIVKRDVFLSIAILFIGGYIHSSELWIEIQDYNLKSENLVIIYFALFVIINYARKKYLSKSNQICDTLIIICPFLWFIFTAISSGQSPQPLRSLMLSLAILLGILPVLLLPVVIRSKTDFIKAVDLLTTIGIISLILGLGGYIIYIIMGYQTPFVGGLEAGSRISPNALFNETNVYADYGLCTISLMLAKSFTPGRVVFLCLGLLGLIASQTRIVWLSMPIIIALSFLIKRRQSSTSSLRSRSRAKSRVGKMIIWTLILPVIIYTVFLTNIPQAINDLFDEQIVKVGNRMGSLSNLDEEFNYEARMLVSKMGLDEYFRNSNIILGLGADSFHLGNEVFGGGNDWLGNSFVAALHDSGLIGFVAFVMGWALLLLRAWRMMMKSDLEINMQIRVKGMFLACCSLLLTGNSNNLTWMTLYWIFYGVLAAGVLLPDDQSDNINDAGTKICGKPIFM